MTDDTMEVESGSDSLRVYEVGYLLLPSIPEEQVPDKVSLIKVAIEEAEGTVLKEESPRLRSLAYDMEKHIGTRNEHFHSAYFGWVKFESSGASAVAIKIKLDAMEEILRLILIKSSLEVTSIPKIEGDATDTQSGMIGEEMSPKLSMTSEQEIDKSIEDLVRE